MAKFKISISNNDGKVKTLEVEGPQAQQFIGKKIGDELEGSALGLPDKLQIRGGSDKDGFPMRSDVHGGVRKAILISSGTGFKSKHRGERRRKTIHGNVITDDMVQINLKTLKK
ncbi:MAG: 30S ribosomal protein S6e [Candidatus Bathyarchaeota archaeon]